MGTHAVEVTSFIKSSGTLPETFASLIRLNKFPMTRLTKASATPEAIAAMNAMACRK